MTDKWRGAARLARIALAGGMLAITGQVWAEGEQPPLAYVRSVQPAGPSVGPSTASTVLHAQVNTVNVGGVVSQDDPAYDPYDSRGADDFTIPGGVASWEISAFEVHGQYPPGSQASVASVNVQFYAAGGANLPGHVIYNADIVPAGDPSSGLFMLNLSPPINLLGGNTYWVSAQAHKDHLTGHWLWLEYVGQYFNPSAWQDPGGFFGISNCSGWGARVATCGLGTNPDLAFRLHGEVRDTYPAPILTVLSPAAAAYKDFELIVQGANFAPGATLQWTVQGSTITLPVTVHTSSRLTANIPASAVSAGGATAQVRVTNPGPCSGSCQSNELTFAIVNRLYLPAVSRP